MKPILKTFKNRGMTLLLTLMVLMILAIITVQFQSDAAVHLRASSNRFERMQCRYAAESGIVIGTVMVREKLREVRQRIQEAAAREAAGITEPNETELPDTDDPEPNEFDRTDGLPSYIFDQLQMELADVDLDIEIHDENAKWPLIWILRPPLAGSRGRNLARQSLERFAELLETENIDTAAIDILARKIGDRLNLPPAEAQFRPVTQSTAPDKAPATTGRSRRYRRSRARRTSRRSSRQKRRDARKRQTLMPIFADKWIERIAHDSDVGDVREPLPTMPGALTDYLGYWGTCQININTASAELLESAFASQNLSTEMAQAIVDYRTTHPYTSTSQLSDVEGITDEFERKIQPLCVTEGKYYSVHGIARRGRTQFRLIGGVYVSGGRVHSMGAVLGG